MSGSNDYETISACGFKIFQYWSANILFNLFNFIEEPLTNKKERNIIGYKLSLI